MCKRLLSSATTTPLARKCCLKMTKWPWYESVKAEESRSYHIGNWSWISDDKKIDGQVIKRAWNDLTNRHDTNCSYWCSSALQPRNAAAILSPNLKNLFLNEISSRNRVWVERQTLSVCRINLIYWKEGINFFLFLVVNLLMRSCRKKLCQQDRALFVPVGKW